MLGHQLSGSRRDRRHGRIVECGDEQREIGGPTRRIEHDRSVDSGVLEQRRRGQVIARVRRERQQRADRARGALEGVLTSRARASRFIQCEKIFCADKAIAGAKVERERRSRRKRERLPNGKLPLSANS